MSESVKPRSPWRMPHLNLRECRARYVAAAAVQAIAVILEKDPELCRCADDLDLLRHIARALTDLFARDGVEVLTDYTRAEIGLPPRGPAGWTVEEILAMERRRLEILTQPTAPTLVSLRKPPYDPGGG